MMAESQMIKGDSSANDRDGRYEDADEIGDRENDPDGRCTTDVPDGNDSRRRERGEVSSGYQRLEQKASIREFSEGAY